MSDSGDTGSAFNRISRDEVLDDLREVGEIVSGVPSKKDYERHGKFSIGPVLSNFTRFTDALLAAGFDEETVQNRVSENSGPDISDSELIDELRRLNEEFGTPTWNIINKHAKYSVLTYTNRFGGMNEARERAGVSGEVQHGRAPEETREELLSGLISFSEELDRVPLATEMDEDGPYSIGKYHREFGSWAGALEAAGLSTEDSSTNKPKERFMSPTSIAPSEYTAFDENRTETSVKDEVWMFVLVYLSKNPYIRVRESDIPESKKETLGRTLKSMEQMGLLTRDSPRAQTYHVSPLGEKVLGR
jgi:hypothetical protein